MRCFVLCTGRCGSTTLARAFAHCTNYTAAHESRAGRIAGRLDYPDDHIEVDNRLSWFLGSLERLYGSDDDVLWVHLTRDRDEVITSYARRFRGPMSIVRAMANGILQRRQRPETDDEWRQVAALTVDTVTDNIVAFLSSRPIDKVVPVRLEDIHTGFDLVWDLLGCEGDREAAHRELDVRHNATPKSTKWREAQARRPGRVR